MDIKFLPSKQRHYFISIQNVEMKPYNILNQKLKITFSMSKPGMNPLIEERTFPEL